MVNQKDILQLINNRVSQVLLIAESSLPASQYQAFRKLTLNEFGNRGIGNDLEKLFKKQTGMAWKGQE